jgi:dihydroneopterin aldolase
MKIYLKFDHNEDDSLKAIGCEHNGKEVSERVFDVIKWYSEDDSLNRASHLSELIHKTLDYEEILFLATKSVEQKMEMMMIERMKDRLREDLRDFLNE